MARYWVTLELDGRYIDVPDGLEGDELEDAIEQAVFDIDANELIICWDAQDA